MQLSKVKPGTFFEFTEPGYCFGRCLFVGADMFGQLTIIHRTASGSRYVQNDLFQDSNAEVSTDVPQSWDRKDERFSEALRKSISEAFGGKPVECRIVNTIAFIKIDGVEYGTIPREILTDPHTEEIGAVVREILLAQSYATKR